MSSIKMLLTFFFLSFFGNSFSQDWIPIGDGLKGKALTKEILEDDEVAYKVRIRLNGMHDIKIPNERGVFHCLSFDEEERLMKPGEPALPIIPLLIAIPSGSTPLVSIESESWEGMNMGAVLPAQKPSFDGMGSQKFFINEKAYKMPFIPHKLSVSEEKNWRGINNIGVQICPFMYYPNLDSLCVMKEFILKIDFQRSTANRLVKPSLIKESSRFGLFDNTVFSEYSSKAGNSLNDNYDYLIIVGSSTIYQSQAMKDFRRWKALKGFKSKAVLVDSIGNDTSSIKSYITAEYSKGVRYVLLVGNVYSVVAKDVDYLDYDNTPTGTFKSDYWYGCILGNDDEQDVAIGRFPVSSLEQFSNIVQKSIRYETWKNLYYRALLMAHKEHNGYYYTYITCCDTIKNRTYSEPISFYKEYGTSYYATNAVVNSNINQGTHIINYRGHASADYLGNPEWNVSSQSYNKTELDSLSSNTNSVFLSIACYTGNIASQNSMLEAYTCSPKGAAAFLGSSTSTETFVNTAYNKMLYRYLLDSTEYRLADISMKAFISQIRVNPNWPYTKNNAYSYICGGDPALELWTATPQKVNDVEVDYVNGNMVVNTVDTCQYNVYISSVDGELISRLTTSNQTVTFTKPSDKFYFSLVKHNRIPYVVYCDFERNSLQCVEVDYNGFYGNTPFAMGEYVNYDDDIGDVVVKNGSKLNIKLGSGGVQMEEGFKVETGGRLIIKH